MAADELLQPLGQKRPSRRLALPRIGLLGLTAGCVVAAAVGILAWVLAVNDPLGGEPVAVARIEKARPDVGAPGADKPATGTWARLAAEPTTEPPPSRPAEAVGSDPVQPAAEPAPKPPEPRIQEAAPAPSSLTLSPAPDPRLVERSRHGSLPRVAEDGSRPADVYARPVVHLAGATVARVAVVVGGMGLSTRTTREAIEQLPGAVTLAFAPYGEGLGRWAASARQDGHEIMLQAPMEPFDYPDNDPGPKTLLAAAAKEQNLDRLHWQMSRFAGYTGILNYMGARFTSTQEALTPVLYELRKRGVFYVDDGSSPRSLAVEVARGIGLPALRATMMLDAAPSKEAIDGKLA